MSNGDEGYGRVTNPERYQVVSDHAEAMLAELEHRYRVTRAEGLQLDAEFAAREFTRRIVRLQPDSTDAAPLTVAFTVFPGVYVRFGLWHEEAYPNCGCDGCADEPGMVIQELDRDVGALVAGRFTESLTASTRRYELRGDDWSSSGEGWVPGGTEAMGGAQERRWAPWPSR